VHLGSARVKAAPYMLVKLTPVLQQKQRCNEIIDAFSISFSTEKNAFHDLFIGFVPNSFVLTIKFEVNKNKMPFDFRSDFRRTHGVYFPVKILIDFSQ